MLAEHWRTTAQETLPGRGRKRNACTKRNDEMKPKDAHDKEISYGDMQSTESFIGSGKNASSSPYRSMGCSRLFSISIYVS
jgi:hypothetical protein